MGKVDDMRAMREAKYALRTAKDLPSNKRTPRAEPVAEALCGRTSISGAKCTRPAGHTEKNHRYK